MTPEQLAEIEIQATTTQKTPCPSCTSRGPVWLDENYTCVYCDYTYQPGTDNYAWIWRVVPLEWWLEEGMITREQIPLTVIEGPTNQ